MRHSIWLLGAALLSSCGPAGTLSGKVTVEGGNPAGIAVIIYGPQSAAAVTDDTGAFNVANLPDGKYVVRATLRGADVEESSTSITLVSGKQSGDVTLTFRLSSGKVTGKVVMADGSPPGDLTVSAVGPETRGVRTIADGSFTFDGLKAGAYVVSVEAPDTREGRVAVGVTASGPTASAGELRLTPVGRIKGTVTYAVGTGAPMPVPGAPVVVTGSNVSAVTDVMGQFSLVGVNTGSQAVLVRVGTSPFFRSNTAMVTVARGENPDLAIALTDDAPKTGTVTGVVTFHGPRSPRDIVVSAPGTGVTGSPMANGQYSLMLPIGVWDVMASAPQHPARLLGRVTVNEGQVQVLPGAELTWWRPLWQDATFIGAGPNLANFSPVNDTVPWSLVAFSDTQNRLALVNSVTGEFRILAAGTSNGHRVSKTGKYAGWYVNQTVFVYEIGTGALQTFSTLNPPAQVQPVSRFEFSSDDSAIFIQRGGINPTLTRVKFATPNAPEVFPPSGSATDIQASSVDRWFVRDSSNAVRLVTPAIDVASVFTNVTIFNALPTAWALTNCTLTCELWVLGPTSNATSLRDTSVAVGSGFLQSFNALGANFDNRGDYPCFKDVTNPTVTAFCVRSSDGTHIALAGSPIAFKLNEAGDRVIWTHSSGLNTLLREEGMPPQTSTPNLGTNAVGWAVGWLSPTRAYAYESSGAPRTMHLVKAGVDSVDTDVGNQLVSVRPPLIHFPQSSTSQWRASVGDGPVRMLPVATNVPLTGNSVRPLGTGPITKYAAISYDAVNSYILDENAGSVRPNSSGFAGGPATRSGGVEFWDLIRPGGQRAFFVFGTNVLIEYQDGATTPSTIIGALGVTSFLGLGDDQRTISLGSMVP